jgi:hypothetical protein
MAPRRIFTPLCGSVRSAQGKAIREAVGLAKHYVQQAAALRQEIETKLLKAKGYECESWSARMWSGGPAQPSPTLGDAIDCGFLILRVQCGSCHRLDNADLRKMRRKMTTPLWTLENSLGSRKSTPRSYCRFGTRDFRQVRTGEEISLPGASRERARYLEQSSSRRTLHASDGSRPDVLRLLLECHWRQRPRR